MWLVECYYYFKDPVASSPATQRHIPDNIHFQSPSREPKIPPMLAIHYEELWSFSIHPTYYTIYVDLNYVTVVKENVFLFRSYKEMLRVKASTVFRTFAGHEICSVASLQFCRKCLVFIVALRLEDHSVNDTSLRNK